MLIERYLRARLGRVVGAVAVGVAVVVLAVALSALLLGVIPCDEPEWGCVDNAIYSAAAGSGVALIAAWPLLHRARVRPAGRVALIGPPLGIAIGWLLATVKVMEWGALPVMLPIGYGIAAALTGRDAGSQSRLAQPPDPPR